MQPLQQSKTLPASQVKNSFGAIVHDVQAGKYTEVIVENHGEPVVAIVPVKELEGMKAFKEHERRRKALEQLKALRAHIQHRVKGTMTDEEVAEIANRFSHELVEDLEKEGKARFERKSP